jgi:hypothetical protein
MLTVPPTTALQLTPLNVEGLPLSIATSIAELVNAAILLGLSTDMAREEKDVAEDACLVARAALVDAIRVELRIEPSINPVVDEAVSHALHRQLGLAVGLALNGVLDFPEEEGLDLVKGSLESIIARHQLALKVLVKGRAK